ncbi:hypothetical protein DRE_04252 [Drechslerella stenobrocha 248]|uniref:Yippee domain-containing protein n=1 Tax=Drechslerella stenobrocha 248 TaxID=1043628 RepID=W7HT74_9PEZI|nr:hypothetical protein DRE_04252 [Drechslerella stenobrocha 248]
MPRELDFPRFLLPAFPRWQPALLKRHRPVEDVTQEPPRPSSSSSSMTVASHSSAGSMDSEVVDHPPRHTRILSHDSGCIISSDTSSDEADEDSLSSDSSDSSSSSSSSSSDDDDDSGSDASADIRLPSDAESGYGGSIPSIHCRRRAKRTLSHQQPRTQPQPQLPPTLPTTTSYMHCSTCRANLCFASAVISKGFTGRHGRAYLVSTLIPANIVHGKPTSRSLQTGAHTVADISCRGCGSNLGWKYIHAEERSQRYKVGKYIVETGRVGKVNVWDGEDVSAAVGGRGGADDDDSGGGWSMNGGGSGEGWESDDVEVDLADEEELEEMFAGGWSKERVVRRRERKRLVEEARRRADSNV